MSEYFGLTRKDYPPVSWLNKSNNKKNPVISIALKNVDSKDKLCTALYNFWKHVVRKAVGELPTRKAINRTGNVSITPAAGRLFHRSL